MRKLENFIKIVVITLIVIAIMLLADFSILSYVTFKTNTGFLGIPKYISEQMEKTTDENGKVQYSLSSQGTDRLDKLAGFAFLLDDAGDVAWSYRLPEDIPRHYAMREIVQFTRFYLNEYPVYVHIVDDGVIVIGLPKKSIWKYQFSFNVSTIDMFKAILPVLFWINVLVLLAAPFLIIRHDAHKRERQRTSWIAGVSHDIRTPLSLVIGYADELVHSAENSIGAEAVTEKAQMIENQAIRIKNLVINLNTSNKLMYGMGVWHREKVLLPALVRESVCGIINRGLDEKYDISVTISENLEQFYVNGDKELIKRLMENLINNAINHNLQGCEIKVSLTQEEFWIFKKMILEISDNGCGVSREQLRNFGMSIQSDKLPEHGLGIRLVRQIASFHHWRVHFLNGKDGGLCCRIIMHRGAQRKLLQKQRAPRAASREEEHFPTRLNRHP